MANLNAPREPQLAPDNAITHFLTIYMKKNANQPELLMDAPADVTTGAPGDPAAADAELIDDSPEKVKADLRKFNRAAAEVAKVLKPLKLILKISDLAGVDSAMEHMKKAKAAETLIENKRKDLVGPWNIEVKRINDHAKNLVKDVPIEILRVKGLVLDFQKRAEEEAKMLRTGVREKHLLEIGMTHYPIGFESIKVDHYRDSEGQFISHFDLENLSDEFWLQLLQRQATVRADAQLQAAQKKLEGVSFFGDEEEVAAATELVQAVKTTPAPTTSYAAGSFAPTKVAGATKTWTFEITDVASIPREYLQVDETKIRKAIAGGTRAIEGVRIFQKDSISLR